MKRRFTQLRISAHSFAIETGRYNRPRISGERRYCFSCKDAIEDERHFLLQCKLYNILREELNLEFNKIVGNLLLHDQTLIELFSTFDSDFTPLFMDYVNTVYKAFEHRNTVI